MNLLHAWKTLVESGCPLDAELPVAEVSATLEKLHAFARKRGGLATAHAWELAPSVCRELDETFGFTPPGTWPRLAGLAAGADILRALPDGFTPVDDIEGLDEEDAKRRLVEAFTKRLIPPAAAAALYVALDVHPVWGLRLGHHVGSCQSFGPKMQDAAGLEQVEQLVFGTLSALLATLRGLPNDRRYPLDALGDVLWSASLGARAISHPNENETQFPPTFMAPATPEERRMLTTRMAIADLFDHVLVPAGVGRRDDAGWFRIESGPLFDVEVGPYGLQEQEEWLCRMLWGEGSRRAC